MNSTSPFRYYSSSPLNTNNTQGSTDSLSSNSVPSQETKRQLDWSKGASLFRNLLSQTSEETNKDVEEWSEFDDKEEIDSDFGGSDFTIPQDSSNFLTSSSINFSEVNTNNMNNLKESSLNVQSELETLKKCIFNSENESDFNIYSNYFKLSHEEDIVHLDDIKRFVESISQKKLHFIGEKDIENWKKLLDQCLLLIDEGVNILTKVKEKVLHNSYLISKLIDDSKFQTYLKSLGAVYCIKRNIELSLSIENNQTTIKYINDDILHPLHSVLKKSNELWLELTEIVKSIIIDNDKFNSIFMIYSERDDELTDIKCKLCCTSIISKEYPIYMHSNPYHSYCANLWVNRINVILPN